MFPIKCMNTILVTMFLQTWSEYLLCGHESGLTANSVATIVNTAQRFYFCPVFALKSAARHVVYCNSANQSSIFLNLWPEVSALFSAIQYLPNAEFTGISYIPSTMLCSPSAMLCSPYAMLCSPSLRKLRIKLTQPSWSWS